MLEGNSIYHNRMDGISVKSGGDPTVSGNTVTDGRGKGVFVHDKGRGVFEGNDIVRNSGTGVTVASGGDPVLRRNRVTENGSHGICVDRAIGLMEENVGSLSQMPLLRHVFSHTFLAHCPFAFFRRIQ